MKHNVIDKTLNAPQGFLSIAITNVIKILPGKKPQRDQKLQKPKSVTLQLGRIMEGCWPILEFTMQLIEEKFMVK